MMMGRAEFVSARVMTLRYFYWNTRAGMGPRMSGQRCSRPRERTAFARYLTGVFWCAWPN